MNTVREQVTGTLVGTDIIPPGEEDIDNGVEPPEDTEPAGWVEALQADTPVEETHQRKAFGAGSTNPDGTQRMLTYVTARFVQDRLDNAVGPANWKVEFIDIPGGVRAGISIRIPDSGEWVTKWDVGTPSNIEPAKGAHSDAFKRAGVQWGIARDLYDERDDKEGLQVEPQPQAQSAWTQPVAADAPPRSPEQMAMDQQAMDAVTNAPGGWFCPIHNDVRVQPAGISQRTGKPYNAFRVCPVPGCDQKEPFRR